MLNESLQATLIEVWLDHTFLGLLLSFVSFLGLTLLRGLRLLSLLPALFVGILMTATLLWSLALGSCLLLCMLTLLLLSVATLSSVLL